MYRAASRDCDHDHQSVERPDVTPNVQSDRLAEDKGEE